MSDIAIPTVIAIEKGRGSWESFQKLLYAFELELQADGWDNLIGQHIQNLRVSKGISGVDISKKVGISRYTLMRIEKNERNSSFSAICSILKYLKSDLHIVQARRDYALDESETTTAPPIIKADNLNGKPFENLINSIVYGECVEVMRSAIPDDSIHLVVTSPPYQNQRTYKGYSFDFESIAKELFRVTKKGGVIAWIIGDSVGKDGGKTLEPFKQALYFQELGFLMHDIIVWEKDSPAFPSKPGSKRHTNASEWIFILSKGKPATANIIQDKPNRWAGNHYWGRLTARNKDGILQDRGENKTQTIPPFSPRYNVWRYQSGAGKTAKDKTAHDHPAIFPESLVEDLIHTYSNDGDVVLDPMAGSCTTVVAARKLKRKFIMVEISEEYCELGRKRLAGS